MLDICQTLADTPSDTVKADTIDAIVGVGERLATRIIAALLRQNNLRGVAIDSTDLIVTNDIFGSAVPDMALTRERITRNLLPMLDRRIIPVVTGFIGATTSGKPTTLGRGGSDYSASILAVSADADEVWIWADVDGMMSTDPREIGEARVIPKLSYDEVAELAYFGARILHARMIAPLRQRSIPLKIKNVFKPQQAGTLVYDLPRNQPAALKAVTAIQGIGLTANHSGSLAKIAAMVDETLFTTVGTHAEVMISSQSSSYSFVCFVIPIFAGHDAVQATLTTLDTQLAEEPETQTWSARPVSIITAVGAGLDLVSPITARIFQTLDGVRILALSQGPAQCSLSIVVELVDAETTLRRIHDLILNSD
jgi:aspartate kinase